jgi:hypothetical protein
MEFSAQRSALMTPISTRTQPSTSCPSSSPVPRSSMWEAAQATSLRSFITLFQRKVVQARSLASIISQNWLTGLSKTCKRTVWVMLWKRSISRWWSATGGWVSRFRVAPPVLLNYFVFIGYPSAGEHTTTSCRETVINHTRPFRCNPCWGGCSDYAYRPSGATCSARHNVYPSRDAHAVHMAGLQGC